VLLGHGPGATPAAELGAHPAQVAWLDATMTATLLASAGAVFTDAKAVQAWARRSWLALAGPGDDAPAPDPVAWRAGRGADAAIGATWLVTDVAKGPWRAMTPLWAGVLAHWAAQAASAGAARLVVAEGRRWTVIDCRDGVPVSWSCAAAPTGDEHAAWQTMRTDAPGPVWVAGHSWPGPLPPGVQVVDGLGPPSQAAAPLLRALAAQAAAEPSFRRAPALSRRVGLALVGTAALVLLVAASGAWEARQAWQLALDRAEARQRLAVTQARQRSDSGIGTAQARQRLQQPWGARWAVAESAPPAGGAWLRLEQRRDAPRLVLVGEAESPAAALAVSRRIAAQPGVAEATLLRSESSGDATRARFELGVRLAEGAP
jgi:hypothetical protein